MLFDELFAKALEEHARMVRCANAVGRNLRMFRRSAYRFTRYVLEMEQLDHNRLVDLVHTEGKTVPEWMDDHYAVLEQNFGEGRDHIFEALKQGVSESDYAEQGPMGIIWRRHKIRSEAAAADIEITAAFESIPIEERLSLVVAQLEAAKSELRCLRRDLRDAIGEIEKLRRIDQRKNRDIERLHKQVVLVNRKAQ